MVKYVLVQFLQKTYILTKICCVLLAFILPDLVWFLWHIIKHIFHVFFCLILKLCTLGNIIFNSASRRWILITLWLISDIKQKSMEYLLNIGKRKYLFFTYFFFFSFFEKKTTELTKWHPLLQCRGVFHKIPLQSLIFSIQEAEENITARPLSPLMAPSKKPQKSILDWRLGNCDTIFWNIFACNNLVHILFEKSKTVKTFSKLHSFTGTMRIPWL